MTTLATNDRMVDAVLVRGGVMSATVGALLKELEPGWSVDVSKALTINELFQVSRQFWAYLQRQGHFTTPREFITAVPHISFVRGDEDVAFLRKRCEA